jgi:arylsulfatase A-like enzyme
MRPLTTSQAFSHFRAAKLTCLLAIFVGLALATGPANAAQDRPNILWITADDLSLALGAYGDDYATTPNLDALAEQSVRYTNAFATAPVCSPSRSTLITGRYAPSLGTHQMRSTFPIPDAITGFPAHLREAGYFTTNNVKTDYNTGDYQRIIRESWNKNSSEAHWRDRADKDRPFFSVFNFMESHQSRAMVWPRKQFIERIQSRLAPDQMHDPADAPVPPYYPDTPITRQAIARYYDCVTAMDQEVGRILRQLKADGLADETIVIFYGDHGSGMPRHKRALLDTGMQVPLLIRFPEKYQHLAPAKPGGIVDRLVSFVDFAPTTLSLAGVSIPDTMQGRPFLGQADAQPREYVFGHRDRVDEAMDMARSVRGERYLYIRNYMPHLGYNQPTAWPDQSLLRDEFYRLADRQRMTDAQWHFAGPTRPPEELYDTKSDPKNLNNLANAPKHQEALKRMRRVHRRHVKKTHDLGFLPESLQWQRTEGTTPWEAARDGLDLAQARQAAEQVGKADASALVENLRHDDPAVRYWGALALAGREQLTSNGRSALTDALTDPVPAVRIEAAGALAQHGAVERALPVLTEALASDRLAVVLHATRTIELLDKKARSARSAMQQVADRAEQIMGPNTPLSEVSPGREDMAMFIEFSARAFLKRLDQGPWQRLVQGDSLENWQANVEGQQVRASDGEICLLAEGKNLWLTHQAQYEDFDLRVQVKMPEGVYNAGIGFRVQPDDGLRGYQAEVDGDRSGSLYAIGSGWLWPKTDAQKQEFRQMAGDAFREGQWNAFRIRCEGDHIQVWVNGIKTTDIHDDRLRAGSIALQHHGRGDAYRYRDIMIRRLK